MCLHYTGKMVSPYMCNYCTPYRLLLSIAAYVHSLMEEVTSIVMDFLIPLVLLPVKLHVSDQACVTPSNAQISLMLLSNIQINFVDL